MSSARALSVAHLSANLRRALNGDLERPEFEATLVKNLSNFSSIVKEEWNSLKELQSFTTGHNIEIMFADRSDDLSLLAQDKDDSNNASSDFIERLDHLMGLMSKTRHYCMPLPPAEQSTEQTQYLVFQLLGFRPGDKKYMQRLTRWGVNRWRGNLSCAVLGTFCVDNTCVNLDDTDDDVRHYQPVPQDIDLTFQSCHVQPIALDAFFQETAGTDHLYEFQKIVHRVSFDTGIVNEMLMDDEQGSNLEFMIHGIWDFCY
jgi:hypothetical protein